MFEHLEWDPRCRAGFLDDDEFNYATPLASVKEDKEEEDEEEEEDDDEEEERDDTEDNIGYLAEKAKEEGKVDELQLM
jgi:hypothetical protein